MDSADEVPCATCWMQRVRRCLSGGVPGPENRMLATVKEVEIIGEAAFSETTRGTLPSWADVIGMRHRLVHAYFDINLDVL